MGQLQDIIFLTATWYKELGEEAGKMGFIDKTNHVDRF
jgi:hypothetical protein